jgi:hypothetical protein
VEVNVEGYIADTGWISRRRYGLGFGAGVLRKSRRDASGTVRGPYLECCFNFVLKVMVS